MESSEIIVAFTPGIVFLAIQLIKWLKPKLMKIPKEVVVFVLVPGLSVLYTYIARLAASPDMSFWLQVALGFSAIFIYEAYKDIKGIIKAFDEQD